MPGADGLYLARALDTDLTIDEDAIDAYLLDATAATLSVYLEWDEGEFELDPYGTHPAGVLSSWKPDVVIERVRVSGPRKTEAPFEAEQLEAERLEAERIEAERLEAERLEAERIEAERLEAERLEAERIEADAARRRAGRSRAPCCRAGRGRARSRPSGWQLSRPRSSASPPRRPRPRPPRPRLPRPLPSQRAPMPHPHRERRRRPQAQLPLRPAGRGVDPAGRPEARRAGRPHPGHGHRRSPRSRPRACTDVDLAGVEWRPSSAVGVGDTLGNIADRLDLSLETVQAVVDGLWCRGLVATVHPEGRGSRLSLPVAPARPPGQRRATTARSAVR